MRRYNHLRRLCVGNPGMNGGTTIRRRWRPISSIVIRYPLVVDGGLAQEIPHSLVLERCYSRVKPGLMRLTETGATSDGHGDKHKNTCD